MNKVKIASVARYLPENRVTNHDLSKFLDTNDEWISSRTGIKERRISTTENTSELCAKVCQSLLQKSNMSPEEIDLIIVATITPDYLTPSVACLVQDSIKATNAFAFDVNAACTGFVCAVSIGEKFLKSGTYKNALIVGGEVLTKILDWEDRSTAVLFGDGAGGVLLTIGDTDCILSEDLQSEGKRGMSLTAKNMDVENPFSKNEKPSNGLKMVGRDIFDFVVKLVPLSIKAALEKANVTMDDIELIVPHQANYRLVEVLSKKLKVNMNKFYTNMDKYGNTSAASIPIALSELVDSGRLKLGSKDKIVITGFGGGLTWGSMVIEL